MLILYEGGFTSVAHDEIIKSLTRAIDAGKKVFLFVPEQQTLTAESEMCELLPPSAVRSFEVTNFTRFTNTVFRSLGGISGEYITSAKKALVMWGALTELSPMLAMTRGAKNIGSGTVTRALEAVNELASYGIRPEDIRQSELLAGGEDARLRSKLSDLSLIYSLYKSKLSERYADVSEDLSNLANKLSDNGSYLDGSVIFIEGFTSFTEPQYALIKAMLKHTDVGVGLTVKKGAKDSFEYTELRETEKRLTRLARSLDADIKLLSPDAKSAKHEPVISEVCELLWRSEGKIDNDSLQILNDNPDILRVFESSTPFEECDFVASDIKRRVMEGASYRDFAIIARSLDGYSGILDTSLAKAGVPSFAGSPKSINSFEAIKLINTAYGVIIRRFAMADVLTYSKCGLLDATKDECDLFELYVTKWNINGSRFTDGILWNMNPRGFEALREGDGEKLVRINEIREKIIAPLSTFADNARAARTVREHAEALLDFLIDIKLEEKLDGRARELRALGEEDAAKQNERLWKIICDSLDTVVDVLGDLPADSESFINQLSVVFSDASIGSIPSYHDEVSVGRADMVRLREKKHVYLLGVNAGSFPKTVTDTSYFTSRDKATLARLGLAVEPDLDIKNARELYSFSRAFSLAQKSVTLIYNAKTASLGSSLPSEVIARIKEITSGLIKPVSLSDIPLKEKIYSPEIALENLGKATVSEKRAIQSVLRSTEYRDVLAISEGKLENDEVEINEEAIGIILGRDIYLSQTKIDRYLKCPFKYFSSAFLGIDENQKAEINQLVVGNFIHSVLENVFNTVISEGRSITDLDKDELEGLTAASARAYVESELGSATSAKNEVIIERIQRVARPIVEGLRDEFANCRFTPIQCELKIDAYRSDTPNSIIYDIEEKNRRVIIGGYIDRLDTLKVGNDVYVRVVDYKTGIKQFTLDDVKKGENLQMLLYLKSVVETESPEFLKKLGVENGGKAIPAGIVYVKTSVADVTVDSPSDELAALEVKGSFERLGASLDDPDVLAAMNPDFTPMAKTKKGEEPKPLTYSKEDWDRINAEMKESVLSIAKEITSGHITASPAAGTFHPCTDCQYKFICRNAEK